MVYSPNRPAEPLAAVVDALDGLLGQLPNRAQLDHLEDKLQQARQAVADHDNAEPSTELTGRQRTRTALLGAGRWVGTLLAGAGLLWALLAVLAQTGTSARWIPDAVASMTPALGPVPDLAVFSVVVAAVLVSRLLPPPHRLIARHRQPLREHARLKHRRWKDQRQQLCRRVDDLQEVVDSTGQHRNHLERARARVQAGVGAEKRAAAALNDTSCYAVVHNVELGSATTGDVDHVVVGPPLAVVETKTGSGRLTLQLHRDGDGGRRRLVLDGQPIPGGPLEQAATKAGELSRLLDQPVDPVVCIVNAEGGPVEVAGTTVCSADTLCEALAGLRPVFEDSQEATNIADLLGTAGHNSYSVRGFLERPEALDAFRKLLARVRQ